MTDKVCKECGYFTSETKCPNCESENFVDKFKGTAYIFNMKESEIAEKINAKTNGKFALKYG